MGRPPGVRNQDYATTRDSILDDARSLLLTPDGANASMRELSRAAKVSTPTLRHYFPTREELVAAVLARDHAGALPHLHHIAAGELPPLRSSLLEVLGFMLRGFVEFGVLDLHVLGLRSGLKHAGLGPVYLSEVLEPSLVALEARLERHAARGELRLDQPRVAALQLLAPLLLAVLHQHELGGTRCRPLALDEFLPAHVDGFIRAWTPTPKPAEAGESASAKRVPAARARARSK